MNLELPRHTDECKSLDASARGLELGRYSLETRFHETVGGQRKLARIRSFTESDHSSDSRASELRAKCGKSAKLLSIQVFDLAFMLMGEHRVDAFLYITRNVDRAWLAEAIRNALLTEKGFERDFNSDAAWRRLRYLALTILLQEDGWVLGIPTGLFRVLLGGWKNFSDGLKFVRLHRNTVRGYLREMRKAGLIEATQPPAWDLPDWCRGLPRPNKDGRIEMWAYNQYQLLGSWQRPALAAPLAGGETAFHEWVLELQSANQGLQQPRSATLRPQGARSPPGH